MKRALIVASSIVAAVVALAVGLAWARPDLVPAWARLRPAAVQAEGDGLYCKEHGVPEKFCTLCHEELKETLMLCKEHGDIPEDICTLCHPEVGKKHSIEMCPKGHGLPKHFCMKCGNGPSASLSLPDDGWCATHDVPEAECAECAANPRPIGPVTEGQAPAACRQPLPVVRLGSAKLVRQVGIRTEAAVAEDHAHDLVANAETAYDANRYAEISPRVAGYLKGVGADLGRAVKPGDVLAVADSSEISAAKAQFISARALVELSQANHERVASLVKTNASPRKDELEALTSLNQARANAMDAERRLRNLGLGDDDLARIVRDRETSSTLAITSPIAGMVVRRHAVQGEAVQATDNLFAVADTSLMWLWIDVYEDDIDDVKAGQEVAFAASGKASPTKGTITWVGTEVDETTRTTRVRAELANPDGRLRANLFGQARIRIGDEHRVIVVPKQAVQRKDRIDLVFLPDGEARYRPQRVVTRPADRPEVVEIAWGLEPGQRVVTQGAFWLKTEIMKGSIGAGCCE